MHVEVSLGPLVLTTGSAFFYIVISISAQSWNKNLFATFILEELPYVPDSFFWAGQVSFCQLVSKAGQP